MDLCRLRAAHDVQRHRLMRVATEAFNFEIEVTDIEDVAQHGRRLRRPLKTENVLGRRACNDELNRSLTTPGGWVGWFDVRHGSHGQAWV